MKNGWQIKRLGDVCEIIKGRKPVLKAAPSTGDLPYLVAKVMRGSIEPQYVSVQDRNAVTVTESETIIICDGSNSGEVFSGFRGILSSTMGKISKRAEIDDNYLRSFLASTFEVFNGTKTGTAIPHLDKEALYRLKFPLPPLPEQRRIVGLLDEALDGIATAKANTEKNLQLARNLFESHLQSIFTRCGEGWEEKPLGLLCDLISGQHIDAKDYNVDSKGVGYLTGPSDFGVSNPVVTKWTEYPKRMAKRGDILITVKGSGVGKINLLDIEEVAISRQLMAVRATTADTHYLYAYLSTKFNLFQSLSNGAAIPGISRGDVLGLMCPMPPPEEQQAILKLIHTVSEQTQHLESIYQHKLDVLEELKKSLLHQAFSGEL